MLFTTTSIRSNRLNVSRTTILMFSGLDRSAGIAITCRCDASLAISISTFRSSDSVREHIVTNAPSLARATAVALPIPLLDPPTMATLSLNPKSTSDTSRRTSPNHTQPPPPTQPNPCSAHPEPVEGPSVPLPSFPRRREPTRGGRGEAVPFLSPLPSWERIRVRAIPLALSLSKARASPLRHSREGGNPRGAGGARLPPS